VKKALLMMTVLLAVLLLGAAYASSADPAAADGLIMIQPLEGVTGPADMPQAASFSWRLPRFEETTEVARAINRYYAQIAQTLQAENPEETAELSFEVVHHSAQYVSIVKTTRITGGNGEYERLSADTFALDGLYAGQKLSLSQLLGMEEEEPGGSSAAMLVWDLVWQIVEKDTQNADGAYLDDLDATRVQHAFDPEKDFYLDTDGNVVFMIQAGELAGEMAGVLLFPFSAGELLSAVGEG